MSKLAHSSQEHMDEIERQAAEEPDHPDPQDRWHDWPDPEPWTPLGDQIDPAAVTDTVETLMRIQASQTDWKREWELERSKFQQETLRTSALSEMLRAGIETLEASGCVADEWPKACPRCEWARNAKRLLGRPLDPSTEQ
jgi:hypothetical protein